ncbi:MAG TPA: nuclear transport factor 2 family protein [Acidimicrobiales bacterium]|nr:nuclear transport factor 2 family protein [Acidimicrobiales bacterium]
MAFTREEIEAAFQSYEAAARLAGETGDWASWADVFTPDATYWEHLYGRMNGRDEIRSWISKTMSTFPGSEMPTFPSDWHVIDEESGRVVVYIQNRMRDPGDGSVHQAPNVSILVYAGDNQWSYQEDIYNVDDFSTMIASWSERVKALGTRRP